MSSFRLRIRGGGPAGPPPIATIAPSTSWNGTVESGFTSFPQDVPYANGKPWCNILWPSDRVLAPDGDLMFGVEAGCDGGLARVEFYLEGNRVDVLAETRWDGTDPNGDPEVIPAAYLIQFDIAAALALSTTGKARLIIRAVPNDPTMEPIIIGQGTTADPALYFYPRTAMFTRTVNVAATPPQVTGVSYKTIKDALLYQQVNPSERVDFVFTESGDYPVQGTGFVYQPSYWANFRAAPGVTVRMLPALSGGNLYVRPQFDRIMWSGYGIQWPMDICAAYVCEAGQGNICFYGCRIYSSTGPGPLRNKATPGDWVRFDTGVTKRNYFAISCRFEDALDGPGGFRLARGNMVHCSKDAFQNTECKYNNYDVQVDTTPYTTHLNSMRVLYSGSAANGQLTVTDNSNVASRNVILTEAGVSVGTFSIDATVGGGHYEVQDVVNWINTIPDWSATLDSNDRKASYLSIPTNGSVGTILDLNCKGTAAQLTTIIDIHGDVVQDFGAPDPVLTLTAKSLGTGPNAYGVAKSGADITVSGPTMTGGSSTTPATATITFAAKPANGDTITVNGVTYTFTTAATDIPARMSHIEDTLPHTLQTLMAVVRPHTTVSIDCKGMLITNRSVRFLQTTKAIRSQVMYCDGDSSYFKSCGWRDVDVSGTPNLETSLICSPHHHFVIERISTPGSPFYFKIDSSDGGKYYPSDHCTFRNCAVEQLIGADNSNTDVDNCYLRRNATVPLGATNTTAGNSADPLTALWVNPSAGDLTPVLNGPLKRPDGSYAGSRTLSGKWRGEVT